MYATDIIMRGNYLLVLAFFLQAYVSEVDGHHTASVIKSSSPYKSPEAQWGHADGFVRFAKSIYHDLGEKQGNVSFVANQYQGEFNELNQSTKGQLGDSLSALFAIRVLDLQNSILHTRKMQELLTSLMKN